MLYNIEESMTKKVMIQTLKSQGVTTINGVTLRKVAKADIVDFCTKKEAKEESEEVVIHTVSPDPQALVTALLAEAKNAGKTKKSTKGGSWISRIDLLLGSESNKNEDGTYFFTIEEAAELLSLPVNYTPFRYSTDWHPSYKGAGRACVQRSFRGKLRMSVKQPDTSGIYLMPLSADEAQALMDKYNYKPVA